MSFQTGDIVTLNDKNDVLFGGALLHVEDPAAYGGSPGQMTVALVSTMGWGFGVDPADVKKVGHVDGPFNRLGWAFASADVARIRSAVGVTGSGKGMAAF